METKLGRAINWLNEYIDDLVQDQLNDKLDNDDSSLDNEEKWSEIIGRMRFYRDQMKLASTKNPKGYHFSEDTLIFAYLINATSPKVMFFTCTKLFFNHNMQNCTV